MIPSPPLPLSPAMEGDASRLLVLFDLYWFRHHILRYPQPPPPAAPIPTHPLQSCPLLLRRHCRSLSDESAPAPTVHLSVQPPRLRTILSGKEAPTEKSVPVTEPTAVDGQRKSHMGWRRGGRRQRKKQEKSKSLTDLEFEELKGFMDLGFTFSDTEATPRLLEIVPGLRRNKAPAEAALAPDAPEAPGAPEGAAGISRPYLSEAWEVIEAKPEEDMLNNWRIRAVGGAVDLKDQLRSWAHAVASTVR